MALREAMQALSSSRDEVQRKNEELQLLATRDPLTGCLNRRAFFDAARPLFNEAKQQHSPMGCLILDIDFFKKVNDTHGHAIGDRVIQEVAKKLQQSARSTDLVCRYGGEEFCVVVAGLAVDDMLRLAERIRLKIEDECGPAVREVDGMRVTVSLGLQMVNPGVAEMKDLIDEADQALYQAKRNGRNRVVLAAETAKSD
jgi:diguanylate cyclase (GGDEF)-like protein